MNPYEATRRAAELGVQRSADGAAAWAPFMDRVIENTARKLAYLTMDDVRDEAAHWIPMNPPPFNLMAFGAAMLRAQRNGVIRKLTNVERRSRTRSQHRGRAVYMSLIYYPGAQITAGGIQPPLVEVEPMADPLHVPVTVRDTAKDQP
jgi:hypothetical protein